MKCVRTQRNTLLCITYKTTRGATYENSNTEYGNMDISG